METILETTKRCPVCAETIKAEAVICRFCGAQFAVIRRGYCSTDHAMVDVDESGKCKTCGNEVMDIRLETSLIAEGGRVAADSRPARSGETVSWVIEPIRGEGVSWRFNGVFLDAIIVNIAYTLIALGVSLSTYLATGVDADSFASIYAGPTIGLLPVMWFLYFFLFEWLGGGTPGKRSSYLKVIRKDGGRIQWWQAAIRAFFSIFEDNIIGAIFIWSTPLKQRIADLIAGTLVVNRERLYKVEYRPDLTTFDFHDYRHVEFAKITDGVLHKFALVRLLTLNGVSPQGSPVSVTLQAQFLKSEFERIRREIERRYGITFLEKIIVWRLLVVVFALLLLFGAIAIVLAALNW